MAKARLIIAYPLAFIGAIMAAIGILGYWLIEWAETFAGENQE